MIGAFLSLLAGLFKTLFVRLPLGIWVAVILCGGWVALERYYGADYPLLPFTLTRNPQLVNPVYPENPSQVPFLSEMSINLNLGYNPADLAFGKVGYGVMLGIAFGLVLAWPFGIWKTLRNYSGFLLFPIRVVILGAIYAGLYGALGGQFAATWGSHLIPSGYLVAFGFLLSFIVPLPFWLLRPLFPSAANRQAKLLIKQARHETSTSLTNVAKHDPTLGDVTKGKSKQEWDYYGTVCGVFIGSLLAEKRGISGWRRRIVESQVRKRLNKQFEKGEHGLTAVTQFCREQLERKTKFTTEVLVGLWLAMQMKGDLNPVRDKDLASSLGAHLIQGMSSSWPKKSGVGTVLGAMLLWTGVAGLAFAAMEPEQVQQQLAQLGWNADAAAEAPKGTTEDGNATENGEQPSETNEAVSETDGEKAAVATQADPNLSDPNAVETAPDEVAATKTEEPAINETSAEDPSHVSVETQSPSEQPAAGEESESSPAVAEVEATPKPSAPVSRSWSHVSGRTIQGVALSYWNGAVELERADGRKAFVEIAQLSDEDRQVIYKQFATPVGSGTPLPGSLIERDWTPASGGRSVLAALVKATAENVELLRADGKLSTIPLAKLSEADQAFAKEQSADAPRQE